jgi:hypothetical protein
VPPRPAAFGQGAPQRSRRLPGATAGAPLKVDRVGEKQILVANDDDWFKDNGLSRTYKSAEPDELPPGAPAELHGTGAQAIFVHADHEIVRYGPVLLALAPGRAPVVFDAGRLHEITFAQIVGKAIVVGSWRNGYAKDVGGKTGYVAAYSIDKGALLWSSPPLSHSTYGFVVTKDHVARRAAPAAAPHSSPSRSRSS